MKFEERVWLHREAYELLGMAEIPVYRATRNELKEWYNRSRGLIINDPHGTRPHYDELEYYAGIKIEIVTIG